MSKDAISRAIAIGAVLALAAAPAALAEKPANPGSQGHGQANGNGHASDHSKAGGKAVVMYVFKGTYAGDGKPIPIRAHLRPGQGEHLGRHAELERAQPVIGDGNDKRIGKGRIRKRHVWHDLDDIWQCCQLQSPGALRYLGSIRNDGDQLHQ